jgi:hypothetical protein
MRLFVGCGGLNSQREVIGLGVKMPGERVR